MKISLCLATITLSLSACASLTGSAPPPAAEIAAAPVIRFGQAAPAGKPFVMHYPAGAALPIVTSVGGSAFVKDEQATLNVRLKRDIFTYKTWASFDAKHWQPGQDLIGGKVELHLPGEIDGHSPGTLGAEFNFK